MINLYENTTVMCEFFRACHLIYTHFMHPSTQRSYIDSSIRKCCSLVSISQNDISLARLARQNRIFVTKHMNPGI